MFPIAKLEQLIQTISFPENSVLCNWFSVVESSLAWVQCKMWSGSLFWALHYWTRVRNTILLSSICNGRL